jgi:hypothetical protein
MLPFLLLLIDETRPQPKSSTHFAISAFTFSETLEFSAAIMLLNPYFAKTSALQFALRSPQFRSDIIYYCYIIKNRHYPPGTHENYSIMMEKGKESEFPEGLGVWNPQSGF